MLSKGKLAAVGVGCLIVVGAVVAWGVASSGNAYQASDFQKRQACEYATMLVSDAKATGNDEIPFEDLSLGAAIPSYTVNESEIIRNDLDVYPVFSRGQLVAFVGAYLYEGEGYNGTSIDVEGALACAEFVKEHKRLAFVSISNVEYLVSPDDEVVSVEYTEGWPGGTGVQDIPQRVRDGIRYSEETGSVPISV